MSRSYLVALGLCLTTAAVAGTGARANTTEQGARVFTAATPIATVTARDFKASLAATKHAGGGGAPTAAVTLSTFERVHGSWRRTGKRQLRGTYFWNTVTGPRALCTFEIHTAATRRASRPSVVVQLLVTPALGCGPVLHYPLA